MGSPFQTYEIFKPKMKAKKRKKKRGFVSQQKVFIVSDIKKSLGEELKNQIKLLEHETYVIFEKK